MAIINKPIIAIDGLSFGFEKRNEILSNVNCSISENSFTVIMGKNGSGKSTLLRLISGIIPYSSGSIKLFNQELKKLKLKERARFLGFLPQHHKAIFPFKVSEVVLTGRASYIQFSPKKSDIYQADKAMELAGISPLKNRIYSELSGGEQQLVMIARLLAQQPKALLLDEPISHLDYNNQIRILKMLKELVANNISVIAVLHDPNMAFLFGEKFIYCHNKKAHAINTDKAWEHKLVSEIFNTNLQSFEHEGKAVFIPQLS